MVFYVVKVYGLKFKALTTLRPKDLLYCPSVRQDGRIGAGPE